MGATIAGTRAAFKNASQAVILGKTGWSVSPIGFGGYRIARGFPLHATALKKALLEGCNLIDTSTNYTDGHSEELVGEVLGELMTEGRVKREQIVVVTKVGYVQGTNLSLAREREESGKPFSEMVKFAAECWHCISPDFLKDQIDRSLARLKIDQIDVLLLHNPEYFLKTVGDHSEYYRRIKQAFEYLEKEVSHGRIQYYGISSNSFPDPKGSEEYTSFETVLDLVESVQPGTNHLAVIQFPFNLHEPGALLEKNNSGKSVTELARERRIGTLINRPLNAFTGSRLIRLADFRHHDQKDLAGDLKESFAHAMKLESAYPKEGKIARQEVAWAHVLRDHFTKITDWDGWKQTLEKQIRPSLDHALSVLREDPLTRDWAAEYLEACDALFEDFSDFLESQIADVTSQHASALNHLSPEMATTPTLSQKAVRLYRSIPGIDCVLVGMRRPEYVDDMLKRIDPPLRPGSFDLERAFESAHRIAKALESSNEK